MAAIGPASFLLPSLFRPFPSPFICSFRPSPPGFAHGPLFASPAYSFCLFALLVLRAAPFRLTCLRARFALPFSCPLPPLSLFVFDLCSFVFAPPSPRLPFSCVSVRSPSRIWAIFPKKGRLVTDERMTCSAERAAIGARCALTRHYAKRVCLERNTLARSVTKERLFCYIAPFIWKKREIAERSEGRMGETNDGGREHEPESQTREAESGVRWSRTCKTIDGEAKRNPANVGQRRREALA